MHIGEPVQLRKARDFGQIFSDTFAFLRQEWRPLLRAIALVGLPAGLIGGFLSGDALAGVQQFQIRADGDPEGALALLGSSMLGLVPGMLLLLVAWSLVVAMVHEYLRAYHLGEHHLLQSGDIIKRGFAQIGPYFGASFLSGLLVLLGLLLCVLPAIYPATVLSLALAAHAIERTGGAGALGRSNSLVSGDFWPTLGLSIVMLIVKGIIDQVIVLPFTIAGLVIGVNAGLESAMEGGPLELPTWISVFNAISTAVQWCAQMLTYPLVAVAYMMKYFSRVEETEGIGLKEKIAGFDQA
ncbi:MAG: hypothetical protein IPF41_16885 [Flavobacteriales bacterium]|nr:hypothetical protein [Flavobacteriales bacterium]